MNAERHLGTARMGRWRRGSWPAPFVDVTAHLPYLVAMFLDQLRERLSDPAHFKPFFIRTADGREFAIRRPFTVLVAARAIAILHRGQSIRVDAPDIVAVADVLDTRKRGRSRRQRSRRS
jgi:hypothetical protein